MIWAMASEGREESWARKARALGLTDLRKLWPVGNEVGALPDGNILQALPPSEVALVRRALTNMEQRVLTRTQSPEPILHAVSASAYPSGSTAPLKTLSRVGVSASTSMVGSYRDYVVGQSVAHPRGAYMYVPRGYFVNNALDILDRQMPNAMIWKGHFRTSSYLRIASRISLDWRIWRHD